eukprot:CAMPEP_0114581052 /NCGR_PEP_ID=MMETSP0125-20121206/5198_1 /TAXON_ID=485358 ORGANISM="Aristerostoma sp., Strain ATCC 50986" /NCGR_SAMPLE_ID=MMETSP0125 /ASSEMBLY_ACC=CAM_ASM_000245 /LENGTH=104 /DNA_ID=CAMNT_0001772949 /DNA_START=182 /DNA_END=496 /DNA_ORIENTATION=-
MINVLKVILKEPECYAEPEYLMSKIQEHLVDDMTNNILSGMKSLVSYPKLYELTMPQYRELLETKVVEKLLNKNVFPGPMYMAGYFMKLVGSSILHHVKVIKDS